MKQPLLTLVKTTPYFPDIIQSKSKSVRKDTATVHRPNPMAYFFKTWKPPADIFYSGNQWFVKIELAGISPDEVELITRGSVLLVRGRRRDMLLRKGFSCHSMEITYSNFERSFLLPDPIVAGSVRYEYQHGLLLVTFSTEQRGKPE